jgi:Domain of unknown function (DUF4136)
MMRSSTAVATSVFDHHFSGRRFAPAGSVEVCMRNGLCTAVAVLLTATVASAQKVNVDSDPAAPFSTYRTYAWTQGTPALESLAEQRLHAAVDAQLAAKGLRMNASGPDLMVATHVTTAEHNELIAPGFGPGLWGFGGGFGTAAVETFVEGTLVVDLYDAKTKKMVWRGVATATASDKPTKNTEKMNKALYKMFEKYPPSAVPSH